MSIRVMKVLAPGKWEWIQSDSAFRLAALTWVWYLPVGSGSSVRKNPNTFELPMRGVTLSIKDEVTPLPSPSQIRAFEPSGNALTDEAY